VFYGMIPRGLSGELTLLYCADRWMDPTEADASAHGGATEVNTSALAGIAMNGKLIPFNMMHFSVHERAVEIYTLCSGVRLRGLEVTIGRLCAFLFFYRNSTAPGPAPVPGPYTFTDSVYTVCSCPPPFRLPPPFPHLYFLKHNVAFVPPNPKLLLSTTSTSLSCFTPRT
jgi:hypothetical protein